MNLKTLEEKIDKFLNAVDFACVYLYRQYVYFKILFARKTRELKKIKVRRSVYRFGYYAGKKIGSKKIMHLFVVLTYRHKSIKQNILVRYIAKELLLYFAICFAFFFVIFFVNQILLLAETILKKRVPLGSVVKLITYCLPAIIAQSAPFATLVGFLMCLGRLVTDNEVLIFRASGQKYSLILKSVLSMGILISLFSFVMNDYFLPLGTINYNKLFKQIIVSNPAIELESMSIKRMNDSTIVIGNVSGNNVSDLVFFDTGKDGSQRIIIAKDSEIRKSSAAGVLMRLDMNDSLVLMLNDIKNHEYDTLTSDSLALSVFENSIISSNGGTSPREMTSWDLRKEIKRMKKNENISPKLKNMYKLEYNKKFAMPFGSIFFAILAFPLSLIFGRKDGQTLGMIFGVIISVLYWSVQMVGQTFGNRGGINGFWVTWGPNFVLGLLGIILYLRLKKK